MTQGFVQVAPDSSGKQLDNDVVVIPAGTIISDNLGNLTTLSAPAYYYRERVVNADPTNPVGIASVRNPDGPAPSDFGLSVRLPPGQADLQAIILALQGMSQQLQALTGIPPAVGPIPSIGLLSPVIGMPPGIQSPTNPRPAISDIFGRQIVVPHSSREAQGNATITITASTSAQTLVAAAGAGQFTDLVAVLAINTSATATELDLSDGTQSIPMYVPAGDMRGVSLGGVLIKATNPNVAWTATTLTSVSSVKVWCNYVQNRQV